MMAVSAFLCAAVVGLVGDSWIAGYFDDRRWLRVIALAVALFLIAAILAGPHHL
jgi:uncharacterized membrane protein YcjF (UPF0283 family)